MSEKQIKAEPVVIAVIRLHRLPKISHQCVCYFVNVYYFNKPHIMKCSKNLLV